MGIKDPYSLTSEQLDAAAELLKEQRENISEYWSDYTKEVQAFESGTSVIGTTWQVIANTIGADNKVQVNTVLPKEGSTGWSDTWMVSSKAAHPNCMYKWMDWITSPEINAQVAEYFGEAPAQTKACEFTTEKDFCDIYHATDADYAAQIHYWTTPQKQCVDGSGDNCTTYDEWVTSGSRSRGSRRDGASARSPADPASGAGSALAFLLVPPMAWLVVAYLGSLAVLLVSAFWTTNSFTGAVVHKFTTDNVVRVFTDAVFRATTVRTVGGGAAGHGDLHRARGAAGVVHGQGGLPADAAAAGDRGDDAVVGQLSGQGVRVADAALAGGPAGLGRAATRRATVWRPPSSR